MFSAMKFLFLKWSCRFGNSNAIFSESSSPAAVVDQTNVGLSETAVIDSMIDSSPVADDQIHGELSETVVIDSEFK